MAKRGKTPKPPMLSLEEQLRRHDANAPKGPTMMSFANRLEFGTPSPERVAWANRRIELVDAMRKRDGKRMRDPGRDASGNFGPSPYAERGHRVETAPRELRANAESQFPKRIATQRLIDRYRAHGHISIEEWQAADELWRLWWECGLEGKVTSGYEPVTASGQANQDHKIAKRIDAVIAFAVLMDAVPKNSKGVVRAVVVDEMSAADWAKRLGYGARQAKAHGLDRLRAGLQALAQSLGY